MDEAAAESLLAFAETAAPGLRGLDARGVQLRIEQRYRELLSAAQWLIDTRRTDAALRLVSALNYFWRATKRLGEGSEWSERALALPGADDSRRAQTLFDTGMLAYFIGDDGRAVALFNRALEVARAVGDATVIALALGGLARMVLRTGDTDAARRLCREALAATQGTADRAGRSGAIHVLAVAAQMAGDFVEARELMNERIALGRETADYLVIASESGNLSMVERQLGNLDRAESLARTALEISDERGDEWMAPYGLSGIAAVATERGEHERAARLMGAAESMMREQGAEWPPDEKPHYEWMLATLASAMGEAAFERARAAGRSMTARQAVELALS